MVSAVQIRRKRLRHEDTRRTLIPPAWSAGFPGRLATAALGADDSGVLYGAGVDPAPEPFRAAADRAVERLCGATEEHRTEFPEIAAGGRGAGSCVCPPEPRGRKP